MAFKLLSDDYIDRLFQGSDFGEPVNSCTEAKKKYIAKSLQKSINGYWLGHTIFNICINGGFLIDTKFDGTKLTELGRAFLEYHEKP